MYMIFIIILIIYYFFIEREENDSEAIDDSVSLEDRVERAKVLLAEKRAAQAQEKAHVSDAFSLVHVGFQSQQLGSLCFIVHFFLFFNVISSVVFAFCFRILIQKILVDMKGTRVIRCDLCNP